MEVDLWSVSADRAGTDSGVCAHTNVFVLAVFLMDPQVISFGYSCGSCRVRIFMHPHLMTQLALFSTAGTV